jgi:CHAT domain-containing protein
LPEAQQVLDLLKEQEYFEFIRRDEGDGSTLNGKATLTPEEAILEKRYREISDRLTALAAERAELFNKMNRTSEEEKRLAQLDKDIGDSNKVFQQFLTQLAQELTRPKQVSRLEQIEESEGLMETLRRLGPGTVALYTLVSDEKYRVILVTADVRKSYEYTIKAEDLNRKVLALREVLQTPSRDPRPLAREMYNVLIGPDLARDLAQAKAQTLMWSLDGVLRYLPMAALYDGQRYFVESYRNVVFTPASHSRLNNPVTAKWRGLGLGVSKAQEGFVGLTGVPEELRGIIQDETARTPSTGVLPGKVILDGAFTEIAMEAELRKAYSVVHIASHFRFQPGNETQSFLLLGDGSHLTLADLKNLGQLFSGVDLLTLSACNTAVGDRLGDGKEVESFGVIAQKKGAGAVMASLWPVMDESTQLFMREFYSLHGAKPNTTKADAIREAQLAMLHGQIRGSAPKSLATNISRGAGDLAGQPRFETDPTAPFAHPYFWAPFILIGNWK